MLRRTLPLIYCFAEKRCYFRLTNRLHNGLQRDTRQNEHRRFEVLRKYTNDADIEKLKEMLYKHPNDTYIFGGRIFKKADVEAYIEYRTKEWL